ncbi:MAG: hypothetical protein KC502_23345 [Myxococcales bacterium]|nr:hypothetical protein [Myxococcales bacterium]
MPDATATAKTAHDLPAIAEAPVRPDTELHTEVAGAGMADAIRAVGLKLAAHLPPEVRKSALEDAHRLDIQSLAIKLPDWLPAATAGATSGTDAVTVLKQVCSELEVPLVDLQEAIARSLHGDAEFAAVRLVADVQHASTTIRRLANDLLDLAGLTSGELAIARLRFEPRDCLDGAIDELRARAAQANCRVHAEVGPEVPGCVIGDPGRLKQVVTTLMGNAVSRSANDHLRLSMSANVLPGRAVELHGAISRLGESGAVGLRRRQRHTGKVVWRGDARTGLGLGISRQLVAQMGGRTWVEAGRGGGSVLHFTVRCELASALEGWESAARVAGQRRILMVAGAVEPIDDLLSDPALSDAEVVVATSADDAMRRLAPTNGVAQFDMLILVASLATPKGRALADTLAGVRPRPPTLLISHGGQRGDAAQCRALGIAGYLPLPLGPTELNAALDALVRAPGAVHEEQHALLVTRHFLREHRRRLRVCLGPGLGDVAEHLSSLGHTTINADLAHPLAHDADLLVLDTAALDDPQSPGLGIAHSWLDDGVCVLLLVANPAAPGVDAHARLGVLARQHDRGALQEALRRLGCGARREDQTTGRTVWPNMVRRCDGDEQIAMEMARAFVAHAPRWFAEIQADPRQANGAIQRLVTALQSLDLGVAARIAGRIGGAQHGQDSAITDAAMTDLRVHLHDTIDQLKQVLRRGRYTMTTQV